MDYMKGQIITASISSLRNIDCDEIWQITRVNKEISGLIWVPELAPSPALFNQYLHEWKDKPAEEWWSKYEEKFNEELSSPEKLPVLRTLWRSIESGKKIALVCFCSDGKYCHRRLVGNYLERHGVRVIEYIKEKNVGTTPEQGELF